MGRYIGPVCRLCRRERKKLYLKGERCLNKCTLDRRKKTYHLLPGQHGEPRGKVTDFGKRLREKQRARRMYGIMEGQFRHYFEMAQSMRGIVGQNLLQLLERRLDNVMYRLGFALSRNHARQLIRHRHVLVNGQKVNIPSYLVDVGDEIAFEEKVKDNADIQRALEVTEHWQIPSWLERDVENLRGRVLSLPTRDQIDTDVEENLIVEFYSR